MFDVIKSIRGQFSAADIYMATNLEHFGSLHRDLMLFTAFVDSDLFDNNYSSKMKRQFYHSVKAIIIHTTIIRKHITSIFFVFVFLDFSLF